MTRNVAYQPARLTGIFEQMQEIVKQRLAKNAIPGEPETMEPGDKPLYEQEILFASLEDDYEQLRLMVDIFKDGTSDAEQPPYLELLDIMASCAVWALWIQQHWMEPRFENASLQGA